MRPPRPPPPVPPPALSVAPDGQREADLHQLRLLAVLHFVAAAFGLLALGFLFLHFSLMNAVFNHPDFAAGAQGRPPPEEAMAMFAMMRWFYLVLASVCVLGSAGNLVSGFLLRHRRAHTGSVVVAGFNCMVFPIGTALGVFSLVVLLRRSVMDLYAAPAPAEPSAQVPQ